MVVGWGGWGLQSHFHVLPNHCVEVVLRCVVVRVVTINCSELLLLERCSSHTLMEHSEAATIKLF